MAPRTGKFSEAKGRGKTRTTRESSESGTEESKAAEPDRKRKNTPKMKMESGPGSSRSRNGSKGKKSHVTGKGKNKGKTTKDDESESEVYEFQTGDDEKFVKQKKKMEEKEKEQAEKKKKEEEKKKKKEEDTKKKEKAKKKKEEEKKKNQEDKKKLEEEYPVGATKKYNPCWNDPKETPARIRKIQDAISRHAAKEIEDRITLYVKEDFPHKLMTYLNFTPNAAERFRVRGGPILEHRVNELYDEEVQLMPHTDKTVDPRGNRTAQRQKYEAIRSTWHALRDRFYHATRWPARESHGWRDLPERLALMRENGSRSTNEAQQLSRNRLNQAGFKQEALRQIYYDVFLEIGLRRTRNSLINAAKAPITAGQSRNLDDGFVWGPRPRPIIPDGNGNPVCPQPRRKTKLLNLPRRKPITKELDAGREKDAKDKKPGKNGNSDDANNTKKKPKGGKTKSEDPNKEGNKKDKKEDKKLSLESTDDESQDDTKRTPPKKPKRGTKLGAPKNAKGNQLSFEGSITYVQPVVDTGKKPSMLSKTRRDDEPTYSSHQNSGKLSKNKLRTSTARDTDYSS